ncbi:MAG: leucine--tRNA ligase [Buchnera aphidicola (Nurudea shiraii)]
MKKRYIPKEIENDIQKMWEKNNTFSVIEDNNKKKYYCLAMIPYPSGKLHMGHVRNYTISDVIARYQRMIGKNVLHPIGWDAFGLPAEIAAIQNNVTPFKWTEKNIQYMKKQLKSLGFSYDWNREITTCKPEYYKWEQWFFIELYKKNLIYKKKSWVNWCQTDQTVLANEQVIDGLCWRCNTKVIKKNISQWFIKITKYAEELLKGLNELSEWPEKVKIMQSNWIGRTSGIEICLQLFNAKQKLTAFLSKPEELMGVTYVAISPLHKLAKKISYIDKNVKSFIKNINYQDMFNNNFDKTEGVNTGMFVLHPVTQKKIPIWIANYMLSEHVAKSILCVPAHNQNDLNFSLKHKIKIKPVIFQENKTASYITTKAIVTTKGMLFNSEKYDNLNIPQARLSITSMLEKTKIGKKKTYYKLKDWGISRQRYWGVPIPMATLKNNNVIPIPETYLPITLLKNTNLTHSKQEFSRKKTILINNELAVRENDTLDTFVESSWYYARYTCPNFNGGMIEKNSANYWLPIDLYIGGIEHSTMHLMYFRFFHKLLRDFGFVQSNEPVKKLLCQGMVLSDAFYYFDQENHKHWINISSSHIPYDYKGNVKKHFTYKKKEVFHAGMIKMSKSKKNGVEPENIIEKYGADTIRLFIVFSAPIESSLEWKDSSIKGMYRFLKKIWSLCYNHVQNNKNINTLLNYKSLTNVQKKLYLFLYNTIQSVTYDIDKRQSFNTAISKIMILVNKFSDIFKTSHNKNIALMQLILVSIVKMMYPFTPHFSHKLLTYLLKNKKNIENIKWPKIKKENIINKNLINILIQIDGKFRKTMLIKNNLSKKEILELVLNDPKISNHIKNIKIYNTVYIPNKLINLVTHY